MIRTSLVAAAVAVASFGAHAVLAYDQNVTPDVIFGSGNTNGSFTTDTANNVELGLRGKLRHNAAGLPENTYNSNGDGTYSFAAIVAPTQLTPTAVWSFEWSINTNVSGASVANGGLFLNNLTYTLGLDTDSSQGVNYSVMFDPINGVNPGSGMVLWDHSTGDNMTANGGGAEHATLAAYTAAIAADNVAQNSWKAHWFFGAGFDPTVDGTYNLFLKASDSSGNQVARTDIQIIVGQGGAAVVPEPASLALVGVALAGLAVSRRRKQAK